VGGRHPRAGIPGSLGLPTTRGGQIEVDAHLRVKGMPDVYALGDCAACVDGEWQAGAATGPGRAPAGRLPAQDVHAATWRASRRRRSRMCTATTVRWYRSATTTTVGSLMGSLRGASWFVEGLMARMMYLSLHLMHHKAVLGTMRTGLMAVGRFLIRRTTPIVKLH
jgi:NADH dehydrogenase